MGTDPGQASDLLEAGREPDGEPQGDDLGEDAPPLLGIEREVVEVSPIRGPHPPYLRRVPCGPEGEQAEPERVERVDLVVCVDVDETTTRGGSVVPSVAGA